MLLKYSNYNDDGFFNRPITLSFLPKFTKLQDATASDFLTDHLAAIGERHSLLLEARLTELAKLDKVGVADSGLLQPSDELGLPFTLHTTYWHTVQVGLSFRMVAAG